MASEGSIVASQTERIRVEWSLDLSEPSPRLESVEVGDEHDLERVLDEIEQKAPEPVVAEIIGSDGARLGIGLGAPNSVLAFNPSPDPPYFLSSGEVREPNEDAVFYLHGHWTEFPGTAVVSNTAAREAASRFIKTGDRPENVGWEEV
jgi:hypothetical protein